MIDSLCGYYNAAYRKLNFTRRFFTQQSQSIRRGLILNFDLNDGCNINCIMCGKKNSFATQNSMPIEMFTSRVVTIFSSVDDFQCGCNFEPLMYPYFEDAVHSISQHLKQSVRGSLICNGTLLTESKRRTLLQSGIFKKVRISFDGATKETFESIRRGANFDHVVANIAALVAEKNRTSSDIIIEFNCTVMKQNISELPQLIRLAADLGINSVSTHKLFPDDYGIIEESYHDKLIKNMQNASELASKLKLKFSGQIYDSIKNVDSSLREKVKTCGFLHEQLLVTMSSDGKLHTPCCQVLSPLGNLLEEDFESIKRSRKFSFMLNCFTSTRDRICKQCYLYRKH